MKFFRQKHFLIALGLASLWQTCLWAESIPDVSIYNFEGRSIVMRSGRAILSQTDLALKPGDIIRTQQNSFVDFIMNGVAGVRLYENTSCTLKNTSKGEMRLEVPMNRVLISIKPLDNGVVFVVETPTMFARVRGTQFLIKTSKEKDLIKSTLVLLKGAVDVTIKKANSTVIVKEGQCIDTYNDGRIQPVRSMTDEELEEMEDVKTIYIPEKEE